MMYILLSLQNTKKISLALTQGKIPFYTTFGSLRSHEIITATIKAKPK